RPNFLDRATPTLRPSKAGRDNQRLTEWMRMPGGASTRLERDACASHACRIGCLEQRVNAYGAGKIFGRPFARTRWPFICRAVALCVGGSFYLHVFLSTLN